MNIKQKYGTSLNGITHQEDECKNSIEKITEVIMAESFPHLLTDTKPPET
jgi:hypothetical protein